MVQVNDTQPPAIPQNVTVRRNINTFNVSWDPNGEPDFCAYNVYYGDAGQPLNTQGLTSPQFSYNLQLGIREYVFTVTAYDFNGNESLPGEASYYLQVPEAPVNLTATLDITDVDLTWQAPADTYVHGYLIYRNDTCINSLNTCNPNSLAGSSYYYDNIYYQPSRVNDNRIETFWRPDFGDSFPFIEFQYNNSVLISIIDALWHTPEETPEDYYVEAWKNGGWVMIGEKTNFSSSRLYLPEFIVTDRIRLVISDVTVAPGLSELDCYTYGMNTITRYTDPDLHAGIYHYQVSTVNRAALQSTRSNTASVEVSVKDISVNNNEISIYPVNPTILDPVILRAIVRNTGEEPLTDSIYAFYLDDYDHLLYQETIPSIECGEKIIVSIETDYLCDAGSHEVLLKVDPDNLIVESEEDNNEASLPVEMRSQKIFTTYVHSIDAAGFPEIKVLMNIADENNQGFSGLNINNFTLYEDLEEAYYTMSYYSRDQLGNLEQEKTALIIIDQTPPFISIDTPLNGEEVEPQFNVSVYAGDNIALEFCELYVDGQLHTTVTTNEINLVLDLDSGTHTLQARAVDMAEYETWTEAVTITTGTSDTTPPVTEALYPTDWVNVDALVILIATDEESGVRDTYYRVDDGNWTTGTEIIISDEGIHDVSFYSVDNAGNEETIKTISVRVDKTPPVTMAECEGIEESPGNYLNSVRIIFSSTDNPGGSGVEAVYYRVNDDGTEQVYGTPFEINEDGIFVIYFYALDYAGNYEQQNQIEVTVFEHWTPEYALLCEELTNTGDTIATKAESIFSNGPVSLFASCKLSYLGTAEESISREDYVWIGTFESGLPLQILPIPDWDALRENTTLQPNTLIDDELPRSDLRFEGDVIITGNAAVSGLLVVEGDLYITGDLRLKNIGIFCTGKVVISGNPRIKGFIYAGQALRMEENPYIIGTIAVNGKAEISGVLIKIEEYYQNFLQWLLGL